jgi:hypothetical protein
MCLLYILREKKVINASIITSGEGGKKQYNFYG